MGSQGPQPPLPSTRVVALGCAHACPSTWSPTSPSMRMCCSRSPAQRHAPMHQLPSSRADRHRPGIRACSPHVTQGRAANARAAMSCSLRIRSNPSVKHCGLKISPWMTPRLTVNGSEHRVSPLGKRRRTIPVASA